jgi:hypothetical protein
MTYLLGIWRLGSFRILDLETGGFQDLSHLAIASAARCQPPANSREYILPCGVMGLAGGCRPELSYQEKTNVALDQMDRAGGGVCFDFGGLPSPSEGGRCSGDRESQDLGYGCG